MPPTVNGHLQTELTRQVATAVVGEHNVVKPTPTVAAEDFSYMLQEVNGCYFWLGQQSSDTISPPPLSSQF